MVLKKNDLEQGTAEVKGADADKRRKVVRFLTKGFGLALMGFSVVTYGQAIPFLFILMGGMMGVPADIAYDNIDLLIWLMSSMSVAALSVYFMIVWLKWLYIRFVKGLAKTD